MRTGDQIPAFIERLFTTRHITRESATEMLKEFHAATYREGYADGQQDECEGDEE